MVQPVCLPNQYKEVRHSEAIVCGWGRYDSSDGVGPPGFEKMLVPIGTIDECIKAGDYTGWPDPPNKDYDICAGGRNRGTESGDSGGPLLVNNNGRWWQIGAVSRGQYLGTEWHNVTDVGLYSRVAKACPWIEQTTNGEVKCQNLHF
ncbi:trypsin domain-containing protein [Ditylenchus destructor]|uniref:Trypsin domain-containing protein n=1 Tax=Ditylenchus destructor TaxID=166010 RepID=A0AAD4MN77_9BILA|nr:trypsin domain-containing protein [Ditylenchus destructor]